MIDRAALLSDLQKLLAKLEADLLERSESADVPDVGATLRSEFQRAKLAERTAQNYEDWRNDAITQHSAAWVLACVFVRFLEDNRLIDPPKIAGPVGSEPRPSGSGQASAANKTPLPDGRGSENRLQRARDEHELFFRQHPKLNDRDYLLAVFDELAKLPGTADLFGEHSPIRELPNWLSGDAAGELLKFFQKIDANSGRLVHDFCSRPESSPLAPREDSRTSRDSAGQLASERPTTLGFPVAERQGYVEETRFLGDLYQDLSEAARKKYALLQTPEFVEEFILDRTLEPALEEFGLVPFEPRPSGSGEAQPLPNGRGSERESVNYFKMIDPACGSGHFLLGSFRRILDRWQRREPGTNARVLVQRTLDSIHGVDVNPFAVAIARFRLLLAAMRACGIERLADAPAFRMNLVCGDSLLHAPLSGGQQVLDFELSEESEECDHAYRSENLPELKRLLRGGQYHAVVANPPYIVPRDKQLNERYRKRFASCHRQYSLAVPFLERIFRLAVAGGYTGQITANSFMKREFGKKLIESFFPSVDLTHVIDTSGAYIPGHGTPTVILFGRHRLPVASALRTVMGIRGEPSTPDDPAKGLVWSAIVAQVDLPGSRSAFVSVGDSPRELFHKHPWSVSGGGAAELKERLHDGATVTLSSVAAEIGILGMTNADEAMLAPRSAFQRKRVEESGIRRLVLGDEVRDWAITDGDFSLFPYRDGELVALGTMPGLAHWLWPTRTVLGNRATFSRLTYFQEGRPWWEWHQVTLNRLQPAQTIVFAFVATHNHFVLDGGGKVFKHSAPIIKLPTSSTFEDHVGLIGVLNSSVVGFLMRQFGHNMGDSTDDAGARTTGDSAFNTFQFNSSQVANLPLPNQVPTSQARLLDDLAARTQQHCPAAIMRRGTPIRETLAAACLAATQQSGRMIAAQEELDWECYRLYGLIEDDLTQRREGAEEDKNSSGLCASAPLREPPPLSLGQRAFEIVLARKMAAGETQTTWFERHGSTPITELPAEWPDDYRQLVQRRIDLIESDPNIRLIEQPEYKRRWNTEPWDEQLARALRDWLLDRLESYFDFDGRMQDLTQRREGAEEDKNSSNLCASAPLREIALSSIAKLADVARQDAEFQQVGELYRDDPAFDVQKLVAELVESESVPLLPVLRYKDSGLRKRAEWERTWVLQREEDRNTERLRTQCRLDQKPARDDDELNPNQIDWRTLADWLVYLADKSGLDDPAVYDQKLEATIAELQAAMDEAPRLTFSVLCRELNRRAIGDIPVPPKYDSKDFLPGDTWRLRGKLDVPKERWISFPHCAGPDGTLVIAWAGYDHLQLAKAISTYYVEIQERLGGRDDPRLIPLLATMLELLPWLKQWHNEPDATFDGMRMGEYFESFVTEEARQLGKTVPEIKGWEPPAKTGRRSRKSN